jgi:hypothetical protein
MALTSRLGQSNSELGNILLGLAPTSLPVNSVQSFVPTMFTGQLGTPLSYPANIVPGSAFFRFAGVRTFNASLSFLGTILKNLTGRLLFSVPATIIVQLRPIILKAVQRTTTQLDSLPKTIDVAVTETYPYTIDVSQYLVAGDTVTIAIAVLTFVSTGATVSSTWQGAISVSGNVIQVPINGPVLALGQQYQLAVTFTASSGKRLTETSVINVVA